MHLFLLGINFKTAPIHIREKFSLSKNEIPNVLNLLKQNDKFLECVLLSTCNRVEVYILMRNDDIETIKDFFYRKFNFDSGINNFFYTMNDLDVIKHLCKVSSGLDSMIIGEPEIFGQVKESYRIASESGTVGQCFKVLFPQAFSVAKKVRSKTGISDHSVSVSYAAVKLAKKDLSEIAGRNVLLLGAGEIGTKTLRNLMDSGVSDVFIANRTFKKAVQLADKVQGIPIMLYEIKEYIQKIDILISSITVPHYILQLKDVELLGKSRHDRPLLLIDLSVPRSIDPSINVLDFINLYNIDDLRNVVDDNRKRRQKESERGQKIINDKAVEIFNKIKVQDIIPTVMKIKLKAEEIRQQNLAVAMQDLNIPQKEKDKIDLVTKSIVDKIIDHTMIKLKEYSRKINR